MINLNKQIILANSQKIVITGFNMEKIKQWQGYIKYQILDENDKVVENKIFWIPTRDWNAFWASFNNGTFLYNQLGLGTAPDSETDFINSSVN